MNAAASVSAAFNSGTPERFPRWVNTLLVAAIGVALAFLSLKALPMFLPVNDSPTNVAADARPGAAARESGPDIKQLASAIANRHLFGDFSTPVVDDKPEPVPTVVAQTRLNLKLAGVFAYNPIERSMAIISVDNGDQEAFQIGSRIVGETTLEEVHRDHIIIKNRGKFEKVTMAEDIKPLPASQIQTTQTQPQNAGANGGAGIDPNAPIELPSTNPGAIRDYLARNPAMLGRVVAAEPYQENGKLLGYRITPKQNPEILEAQGIVAGDVITRVNNIQINSQKQGIRALRNVVKAEQLDVVVLRDGVEVPLSISLAQ